MRAYISPKRDRAVLQQHTFAAQLGAANQLATVDQNLIMRRLYEYRPGPTGSLRPLSGSRIGSRRQPKPMSSARSNTTELSLR